MTPAPRAATHVFRFTDIEGSTRRWETDREAMSVALARQGGLIGPQGRPPCGTLVA